MKIDLLSRAQLSIINKNNLRYPLAIAEKDYILAIVLQVIYDSNLKDRLIFKGGTAIHHLYLNQLRFSEDLDFATTGRVSLDDFKEAFKPYKFLEIVKHHPSNFALKIERLKFVGPLGQPNSIKIDIDLAQDLILPAERIDYRNIFRVPVTVPVMALKEICAEKVRAINERARYRDFYDLTAVLKRNSFKPAEIIEILKQKELRRPLSKDSILDNFKIADEAMKSGAENLFYREEIDGREITEALSGLLNLL